MYNDIFFKQKSHIPVTTNTSNSNTDTDTHDPFIPVLIGVIICNIVTGPIPRLLIYYYILNAFIFFYFLSALLLIKLVVFLKLLHAH